MKGILALLFLLLLICSSSRSQNLVPNPSFEEFEGNCPDSTGFEELKTGTLRTIHRIIIPVVIHGRHVLRQIISEVIKDPKMEMPI